MRVSVQSNVWRAAAWLARQARAVVAGIAVGSLVITASIAATMTYEYDVHGRLKKITREDGSIVIYTWDAATNRTQVETYLAPGVPPSISVPSSSGTGSFTVSWGAASGTVSNYELYEATNSSFSGQVLAYSGVGTSYGVSGKGDGTYYYRVRACNNGPCSDYRAGANGATVTLPPGIPASITVPSSSTTGSYTVSWGASTGTVTAYELYEATNSSFSGQVLVYSGAATSAALSGRANGTYYYRVRACNASGCSAYRSGGTGVTVSTLQATVSSTTWSWFLQQGQPAQVDPNIVVTASGGTGGYTYAWQWVSGDTQTTVVSPTSYSTKWSRTVPSYFVDYTSVWRCRVTDSSGAVVYTPNVTVNFRKENFN